MFKRKFIAYNINIDYNNIGRVINMITKLIMKNFKSFKNETIVDLTKTKYEVLGDTNAADNGILKGLMFVGANASGKSNVILAIRLLLDLLFMEREINQGFLNCLLSKETEFSLDYYFLIDNEEIRYLFKNDIDKKNIYERLYVGGVLKLERMGLTAKTYLDDSKEITYGKDDLDEETLSLRKIYFDSSRFAGNEVLRKWYDFLKNSIYFNAFEKQVISYGKVDYRIFSYLKEFGAEKLNTFFDAYNFDQSVEYTNESKGKNIIIKTQSDDVKELFFKRKGLNVPIPFDEESLGNRTLLNMLPSYLQFFSNNGMLLIDEFSSGFHNDLEKLLISNFMMLSKYSQMIFVSHSTNLLSTTLLRPDQIYSVNFDGENGSKLKRFSVEQPRFAQNIEKMYLSGVFDGLPNYKNDHED